MGQDDLTRRRLLVRGRVQGVGYRWFVREQARALGLSGSVRNHADGSVEVVVAGASRSVDALVRHLERGPAGADVASVEPLAGLDEEAILPTPFAIER